MVRYEGPRDWLNYMAALPKHQRREYGGKLVEKAVDELKRLGRLKVSLQVRKSNVSVVEFYKHPVFKDDDVASLGKRLK
jgi:hypothetical protein